MPLAIQSTFLPVELHPMKHRRTEANTDLGLDLALRTSCTFNLNESEANYLIFQNKRFNILHPK